MTTSALAKSYLQKCLIRMEVLRLLMSRAAWSDVVRESQELAELGLKGMLRALGVDPPKVHELSGALTAQRARFPDGVDVDRLVRASVELRRDRELSFYGAEDVIPTEFYTREHAEAALAHAEYVLAAAQQVIGPIE